MKIKDLRLLINNIKISKTNKLPKLALIEIVVCSMYLLTISFVIFMVYRYNTSLITNFQYTVFEILFIGSVVETFILLVYKIRHKKSRVL
jgi:hypothetical protein